MGKKEAPINQLQAFLPPGTYDAVAEYLVYYKVHLTVARERKSILGDYRHRTALKAHRISVNGNLNAYSFLITLIHELAHLLQFEQYGNKVMAHGREWKTIFGQLLAQFVQHGVFPDDIKKALQRSLEDASASSCADDGLQRVLKKYDKRTDGLILIEDLPDQTLFKTGDGRVFQKGERLRKRFKCVEVGTKKLYLFSPVYEVEPVR
jgi:hypothetical protein